MITNAGREALEGYEEPRDDLAAIRVADLPPWECCGRRGPHWPSCPNHPDTPQD